QLYTQIIQNSFKGNNNNILKGYSWIDHVLSENNKTPDIHRIYFKTEYNLLEKIKGIKSKERKKELMVDCWDTNNNSDHRAFVTELFIPKGEKNEIKIVTEKNSGKND
ncbi:unnamed protein product, partial [Brachionus calyciflorus]